MYTCVRKDLASDDRGIGSGSGKCECVPPGRQEARLCKKRGGNEKEGRDGEKEGRDGEKEE